MLSKDSSTEPMLAEFLASFKIIKLSIKRCIFFLGNISDSYNPLGKYISRAFKTICFVLNGLSQNLSQTTLQFVVGIYNVERSFL